MVVWTKHGTTQCARISTAEFDVCFLILLLQPGRRFARRLGRSEPKWRVLSNLNSLRTTDQLIGPSVGVGLNGTITGPLLNATLVSLTFTEISYSLSPNSSYATSYVSTWFVKDDGQAFSVQQKAALSEMSSLSVLISIDSNWAPAKETS